MYQFIYNRKEQVWRYQTMDTKEEKIIVFKLLGENYEEFT